MGERAIRALPRRHALLGLASGMAAAALPRVAAAQQAWPARRITFVMPFAAGGGPDILGRLQAAELARALGVSVVVENRTGAGGVVAAESVAQGQPDGYTVM